MFDALDKVHARRVVACVIQGEARGADTAAKEWAFSRGIPVESYPADWNRFGRSAGFRRNEQMLREGQPTGVVAFPGGPGTAMMIELAEKAGVPVWCPLPTVVANV